MSAEARIAENAVFEIRLEELHQPVRFRVGQRAQQHGMHDAEHGSARADAKRQRQNGGRRDDRGPAQAAPGVAEILAQHGEMFRRRGPHEIQQQTAPEAPPAFFSSTVPVQSRHLATEFLAKVLRIQVQETPVPPLTGPVVSHDVLRLGVRPAARAWRRSVVSRSASVCATSRPNFVSR